MIADVSYAMMAECNGQQEWAQETYANQLAAGNQIFSS